MSVYIVARIQIDDRDEYTRYEAGFMDVFAKYAGELLAVDEAVETLEGEWPGTRTVILRFPSREDARRWYDSSEYQELAQHRFRASQGNIAIVSGLDERSA